MTAVSKGSERRPCPQGSGDVSQGLAKSDRQTTNLFIARKDGEAFGQVAA